MDFKIQLVKEFKKIVKSLEDNFRSLKKIAEQKITVLLQLRTNLKSFYDSESIYSKFVNYMDAVIDREIEEVRLKVDFYNKIPSFQKSLGEQFSVVINRKPALYKYFNEEFHYLKKIDNLKSFSMELVSQHKSTEKNEQRLERNLEKLRQRAEISAKGYKIFAEEYNRAIQSKFVQINPIVNGLINKKQIYFSTLDNLYTNLANQSDVLLVQDLRQPDF